ncbi:hypothetical protein [Acinetobacter zhairhuonensis]
MKGTLADFNFQINEGVIQGDDGKRYSFFGSERNIGISICSKF